MNPDRKGIGLRHSLTVQSSPDLRHGLLVPQVPVPTPKRQAECWCCTLRTVCLRLLDAFEPQTARHIRFSGGQPAPGPQIFRGYTIHGITYNILIELILASAPQPGPPMRGRADEISAPWVTGNARHRQPAAWLRSTGPRSRKALRGPSDPGCAAHSCLIPAAWLLLLSMCRRPR